MPNSIYHEYVGQSLKQILKSGHAWDAIPTSIPGVFLMILPSGDYGLEIIPIDEKGHLKKPKGIYLKSMEILEDYKLILNDPRVPILLTKILEYKKVQPKAQMLDLGEKHATQTEPPSTENRTSDTETDAELSDEMD